MTVDELAGQCGAEAGALVIDVRSAFEFRRGHVPGAVHLPFWAVLFSFPTSTPAAPVVLYCGHGPRAWIARAALRVRGVRQVYLLEGHMAGWRRAMRAEQTGEPWRPVEHPGRAKGLRR